jgi:hypothetical protein
VLGPFSLSPSLQPVALSPNADAMPHNPPLLGGIGGLPQPPESVLDDLSDTGEGSDNTGISSSHTFSITPVRMKAHSEHVDRKRVRHHPDVHSGYIVDCDFRVCCRVDVCEGWREC